MKKLLSAIMVLTLMLTMFAGCGGTNGDNTDGNQVPNSNTETTNSSSGEVVGEKPSGLSDEIITVALPSEPNQIVPNVVFCSNEVSMINNLLYEPLIPVVHATMQRKENGPTTNVEYIDETHIRLTLREGVKFQNGEEFTTADVKYMFEEGAKGAHAGDRYFVFDVANFVIEGDYSIIIALTQPWAQAAELMGFEQFSVISKTELSAIGGAGKTQQYIENAGTGKYKFKQWVPGEYIEVERNEDYWNQEDLGYYAGFKFVFINDSSARGMAVQSGDVDIAAELSLANHSVYEADKNVKNVFLPTNNVSTIFLNSGNGGPLEDGKVREAVACLIDKQAIRQIAASGFGEICDTIISPAGPMWDGKFVEGVVDVDKAKTLLAEAGYPNGLKLRLRTGNVTEADSLVQEQLRQGGIEVELVLAERPVHFEGLAEGDFDMYLSAQQFAYYTEPVRCTDGITNGYRDVMGGCGYKNEEYTEIAKRCYSTSDLGERKAAYAELQEHFRANNVSIPLYTTTGLLVSRPDIEGFGLRGVGTVDLSEIYGRKN